MPYSRDPATSGALTIDGVTPSEVIAPHDAQETAGALADAAARGQTVAPVGGGTALALGNPLERLDLILSTTRLSGIIDYEPTDLVLSVGAGASFGDVQAVLGEHGQRLPIDPPGAADTTIGGLIATALWGPLRYSAGTLRDLLIGISVAHPSGTVSRAGGMVVKNVSGYDMPRLYLGSLGTLGVIVSANFKVLPRPRAEATVLMTFPDPHHAFAAAARLHSGRDPLAALEISRQHGQWIVSARIEGREQTVAAIANRVVADVGADAERRDGPDSAAWWAEYVAGQKLSGEDGSVLVRCGDRPKNIATLAVGIANAMDRLEIGVSYLAASPGIGAVVARLDLGDQGSAERLAEVQSVLLAVAETVTILAAPTAWKQGIDVWGRHPDGFEVMRALREEFDPNRTINPGRFAGFL
jgi:glycolate oxidase FAD binding subunit